MMFKKTQVGKDFWYYKSDDEIHRILLSQKQENVKKQLNDTQISRLKQMLQASLEIVNLALDKYEYTSLSFNGGKDSVVMLNIVQWALIRRGTSIKEQCASGKLIVFHLQLDNSFKEMDLFMANANQTYGMKTMVIDGHNGMKVGLEALLKVHPKIQAVFMGVRKADPHGSKQRYFEKTTPGWPEMIRVNPILDWDYDDVWNFLIAFQIPYCSLYDDGYTSLGCVHDSMKNPSLKVKQKDGQESYLPAYRLHDESKERDSRIVQSKK